MKLVTIMILLWSFLGLGCSSKEGFFSPDALHESALRHSQKGEIYNSLEMKASIVATYLNSTVIQCNKVESEVFLIAIYIDEDSSDESKQGILNPSFTLSLEGQRPSHIEALPYDDDLIKIAPFRNRWSTYYKVDFPHTGKNTLTLIYRHLNHGEVTLKFLKDY